MQGYSQSVRDKTDTKIKVNRHSSTEPRPKKTEKENQNKSEKKDQNEPEVESATVLNSVPSGFGFLWTKLRFGYPPVLEVRGWKALMDSSATLMLDAVTLARRLALKACTAGQGLTLVHFPAQLQHIMLDRGALRNCLSGVQEVSGGVTGYQGVFRVYFVSETAQVELRSGRV